MKPTKTRTQRKVKNPVEDVMSLSKRECESLAKKKDNSSIATMVECCEKLTEIMRAKVGDFVNDSGSFDFTKIQELKKSSAIAELDIRDATENTPRRVKVKMYNPMVAIDKLVNLLDYGVKKNAEEKKKDKSVLISIVNNSNKEPQSNVKVIEQSNE